MKEEVKAILENKVEFGRENGFHMMATKAYHLLGDISSDEPDICFIYGEADEYWVGQWVTGFGFFDVLYPKETTRELTDQEIKEHDGKPMSLSGQRIADLKVHQKRAE